MCAIVRMCGWLSSCACVWMAWVCGYVWVWVFGCMGVDVCVNMCVHVFEWVFLCKLASLRNCVNVFKLVCFAVICVWLNLCECVLWMCIWMSVCEYVCLNVYLCELVCLCECVGMNVRQCLNVWMCICLYVCEYVCQW